MSMRKGNAMRISLFSHDDNFRDNNITTMMMKMITPSSSTTVARSNRILTSDEDEDCCMVSESGQSGRRRRRGVIEKRRRDRINTSLMELKRLVPTALEKSGSAKLEKAEILQMTVEHLKSIQHGHQKAAGHATGFKECVDEVARYLVAVEGMNTQDPLRIRLISHLQMMHERGSGSSDTARNNTPPNMTAYYTSHYQQQSNVWSTSTAAGCYDRQSTYYNTGITQIPFSSYNETSFGHYGPQVGTQSTEHITTVLPPESANYSIVAENKPYRPWGTTMTSC